MKTYKKVITIIVLSCIVAGIILMSAGYFLGTDAIWNGNGDAEMVKVIDESLEPFTSIYVKADLGSIELVESDSFKIEVFSTDSEKTTWSNDGGNLVITSKIPRGPYSFFSFNFVDNDRFKVKIYMPKAHKLDDVSLDTSSGKVEASNFVAKNVFISSDFGEINTNNIVCDELEVDMNSGGFEGKNINVNGHFEYDNDFGSSKFSDITVDTFQGKSNAGESIFENFTAREMIIENDFGKVVGKNLTVDDFYARCNSGKVDITGEIGKVEIDNDFGAVFVKTTTDKSRYKFDLDTDFGKITLDGQEQGAKYAGMEIANGIDMIIKTDSGDIDVVFNAKH